MVKDRREQARLLFEKGYAKLLAQGPGEAENLFLEGLKLDSESASAIFYWGHARVLTSAEFAMGSYEAFREDLNMGSYEAFREALKMGLPGGLSDIASAHVRHLEQRKPCYKDWYEALPNQPLGSCF